MFAVVDYEGDRLRQIRLHPIELGFHMSPSQRGRPMLADAATSERILKRIQRLSARYGTEICIKDGIGVVNL